MKNHPLIKFLLSMKGNPKACVYTEPLFAIPTYLYTPFVSVYMAALMLTDKQIGMVASAGMLFQAVSALFGGAITDKYGRRKVTFWVDFLAWSIPCLLWAFSQNFWWFMAAAAFNGMLQITGNAWTCLLVEDAEKSALVKIYSLIQICGQISVIFAPLAGLLVNNLTVVPAMRILYGFSFVCMTAKFILLYVFSTETGIGKTRLIETKDMSVFGVMSGYGKIFKRILSSPRMRLSMAVTAIFSVTTMVINTFMGLYTTGSLGMPAYFLAVFPIIRSLIITFSIFVMQPRLERFGFRRPMLAGVMFYAASHAALILAPEGGIIMPLVYVLLEACAHSLVIPRKDSLAALFVDPKERARISGTLLMVNFSLTIPFGYLAGILSDIDRRLPFLLNILIFGISFGVIFRAKNVMANESFSD